MLVKQTRKAFWVGFPGLFRWGGPFEIIPG